MDVLIVILILLVAIVIGVWILNQLTEVFFEGATIIIYIAKLFTKENIIKYKPYIIFWLLGVAMLAFKFIEANAYESIFR